MIPVFQTTFGYPTGNCFNAAVASVLELPQIPDIDPTLPMDEWVAEWCAFFDGLRVHWNSRTWEPESSNWDCYPSGIAIACVEVKPGVLHAVVCENGKPIHDVMPGAPFLRLSPEQQRQCRIVAWSHFEPLGEGQTNGFEGFESTDFTPAAITTLETDV